MSIKNLFSPTLKSLQKVNEDIVYLTRHGNFGSVDECKTLERSEVNDFIRAIQDHEEKEFEAKEKAMKGNK